MATWGPGAERHPLLADAAGRLWTALPGRVEALGVDGSVAASLALEDGAVVSAAVEDGEGNLWLGTSGAGLYRVRRHHVSVLGAEAGLTDGQVSRASRGVDDDVLVLDAAGRLFQWSPTGVDTLFEPERQPGRAEAAVTDGRQTVWVAILESRDLRLRGRRADGTTLEVDVPSMPIKRIVPDPRDEGVLWLAGSSVYAVRPEAPGGPRVEGPFLAGSFGARDLIVTRDGTVWVAGPQGVARIVDREVETFLATDGYPTGDARALLEDEGGALWIGRYFGGLVRYSDGAFDVVRRDDGLWDDVVSSLLDDGLGNLWMGSNAGVHRVSLAELEAFFAGRTERVRGVGYGRSDGFRNPEASGWHGYRDMAGRLWFPTFSGAAVVRPDAVVARQRTPPRVQIQGVRAGARFLPADSVVRLARGVRRVDVAFGAVALTDAVGMRYQVRLDGVDDDWVDVGGQRQVTYATVPPGRRTFRVRAVNGAGVESTAPASLALVAPPLFTETPAYRLLLALLAAGVLAAAYHLRIRQLRAREAHLEGVVADRTRALFREGERTRSALARVEEQAAELLALHEAKSRFYANVSHELRTPLTLVQGPLRDVLDGRLGPTTDSVREQVEIVLASGLRLGELVEQLLDVARLESGTLRLDVRRQDQSPLLRRLAASFGALARTREIDFEARVPAEPLWAALDADQMEKVYGNLLANAMKFTATGGTVRFSAAVEERGGGGELVVTVEDDGPGIPHEEQGRVFERFHQADGSARRVHGGVGLGLALVKEITESHGGTVTLDSTPGAGSRFTVRTPVEPVESVEPTEPLESVATVEQPERGGDDDEAARPTVLVVEDHDDLRAYVRRHLEGLYRVVEAVDGHDGLERARQLVPDLILCDIMMPGMDGEELCRAIRRDPDIDFLPVVMITARAGRDVRLSALEGGADDYLVKPFDPEELRLRIRNLLHSRRRLRERIESDGRALPRIAALAPQGGSADDTFLAALDAVLAEHLGNEDFDAEAMARALSMSRATLYRKTEAALGDSPVELLWRTRLRQAAQWLDETDATVSEVAYACGFKTVPHFTRRFKELFGTTPGAYRRGDRPTDGAPPAHHGG